MSSEPLKKEEVVKFADQLRKIFGWIKRLGKFGGVLILAGFMYGCALSDFVRIINQVPIPEPTQSTPTPVPTINPLPTVVPTASPVPTSVPTATPLPMNCLSNQFLDVRDGTCKLKPILVLFKVQGFNPNKKYNCHNPEDGPKFITGKVCVKDSTRIFCDPNNMGLCGPCDTDHPDYYNTFCQRRDWDDPRGPSINVSEAHDFWKDEGNPYYTNVHFKPGVAFTICIRPFADDHTADGIHLPIHGTAASCVTETYH